MTQLIVNFLFQLFYYVVLILLMGFIIGLLNKLFYSLLYNNRVVCFITGLIGTPIHELSHALMCIIFMHKIEEMRLYRISNDGVLGYVDHTYNKKNIYAASGNYLIGAAPIIVGSVIIYLLTIFLLKDMGLAINNEVHNFVSSPISFNSFYILIKTTTINLFTSFSFSWQSLLYIFIVLCLALHMNLSNADIKCALLGLPFLVVILALVNVLLYYLLVNWYEPFLNIMFLGGSYLLVTLLISLLFSLVLVLFASLIRLIIVILKPRNKNS